MKRMSQTVSSSKQQKYEGWSARLDMKVRGLARARVGCRSGEGSFIYRALGGRVDGTNIVARRRFSRRANSTTSRLGVVDLNSGKGAHARPRPGSFRGGLIVSDIEAAQKVLVAPRHQSDGGVFPRFRPSHQKGRISGPESRSGQSYRFPYAAFERSRRQCVDRSGGPRIARPGAIDPATTSCWGVRQTIWAQPAMRRGRRKRHGEHEKRHRTARRELGPKLVCQLTLRLSRGRDPNCRVNKQPRRLAMGSKTEKLRL